MSEYSDLEERFITANAALVKAVSEAQPYQDRFIAAQDASSAVALELGQSVKDTVSFRDRAVRTRDLLYEAARRAGFEEGSPEFGWVAESYTDAIALVEAYEAAEVANLLADSSTTPAV